MSDEQPQRRQADRDRRRWNDDRLDDLALTVRALGPLATQVARHDAVLSQVVDDLADFKQSLTDVESRVIGQFAEFRDEYRADRDKAKRGRGAIVIAAITAASSILVALIGAAAIILSGGAPSP